MPRSAWSPRRLPSNENGRVTTPTVSAPSSRAISATIGAPPVPVPPPSPAVTKTMSAPLSASFSSSRLSCGRGAADVRVGAGAEAARRAASRSEPSGRPRSMSRACASVLTAMNSTPATPASTMRLTAFVPPPPTPATLMTARKSRLSSWCLMAHQVQVEVLGLVLRPEPAQSVRPLFPPVNREKRAANLNLYLRV